jgi:hypothetical protein
MKITFRRAAAPVVIETGYLQDKSQAYYIYSHSNVRKLRLLVLPGT